MTDSEFTSEAISRRGLLKGAIGASAVAVLGPLVTGEAKANPKRGGILRLGIASGSSTDSYDPAILTGPFSEVFATARHGYLTEIEPDGSLSAAIAERWESSPDATVWTFKLRKGITFHNGKKLSADDVIASINYHRGEDSTSAARPYVAPIIDIKSDGPDVVVFTLEGGIVDFPFYLANYHLPIMQGKDGKIDPTSPDGCGGYVVDSYEPGVSAKLTRYPHYWKSNRAHFDGLVLRTIADSSARQSALMSGEVDAIDTIALSTARFLERTAHIRLLSIPSTQQYCFPMDVRIAPFKDKNVRLALKYAIDRQEMVDKILYGYGVVGNDNPIAQSQRFYAEDLPVHEYDPEKARFYLKKAGLSKLNVSLSTADAAFNGAVNAANLYSARASKANIHIDVVREPSDGYWSNIWKKKPWCASYWSGAPTCDLMFSQTYAAGVPWNESYWDNERFNKLLVAARSESDDRKRASMYHKMQSLVSNDGGTVIPMFANYVMALSNKVQTPERVAGNLPLDGLRAPERWWFE